MNMQTTIRLSKRIVSSSSSKLGSVLLPHGRSLQTGALIQPYQRHTITTPKLFATNLSRSMATSNSSTSKPSQPITVIGAGVLGLSAATTLQTRHPKAQITIIAAEIPTLPVSWNDIGRPSADYASMWAGAHYRPIPRSTRQLEDEGEMAVITAKRMFQIEKESPDAGVKSVPAIEYLEDPPEGYTILKSNDLYAGPEDRFRVLEQDELPEGVKFGCSYQAYVVNVHVYCAWLHKMFEARGGKVIKERLQSLEEVFGHPDLKTESVVVNCSGRNFDTDPLMQHIRGQTVLVRNEYHSTITRQTSDGGWAFLIPRPGRAGTVVGGTKEIGDTETQARPESRQKLLQEAVKAFPDFVDDVSKFDVIMDNVGRRPWREGGLRIESEELSPGRKVIHGYGAGGRGYEISWGVAERIADLYDREA